MGTDRDDDCYGALPLASRLALMRGLQRRRLQLLLLCGCVALLLWTEPWAARRVHQAGGFALVAVADPSKQRQHTKAYRHIADRQAARHTDPVAASIPCDTTMIYDQLRPLSVYVHTKLYDFTDEHGHRCSLHSEQVERFNVTLKPSVTQEQLVKDAVTQSLQSTIKAARQICSAEICGLFFYRVAERDGERCGAAGAEDGALLPIGVMQNNGKERSCVDFATYYHNFADEEEVVDLNARLDSAKWAVSGGEDWRGKPDIGETLALGRVKDDGPDVFGASFFTASYDSAEPKPVFVWLRVALVRKPWEDNSRLWQLWGAMSGYTKYGSGDFGDPDRAHSLRYRGVCVHMSVDEAYHFNKLCMEMEQYQKEPTRYIDVP